MKVRLAIACFVVPAVSAGEALSQVAVDWQANGSLTHGVTNNVANTPEPPEDQPDAPGPQWDSFGILTPSFEVVLETEAATQTLGWVFGYTFYFVHPEANAFNNGLSYGLRAPMSESSDFTFAVSGSQANLSNFVLVQPPANQPPATNEGGDNLILTVGGGMGLSAQVGETMNYSLALGGQYAHTLVDETEDNPGDDLITYVASASTGLSEQLFVDSIGGDVGTDVQVSPETEMATGVQPFRVEVVHRGNIHWGRQWAEDWSTQAALGAAVAYDAAEEDPLLLPHPTGRIALLYTTDAASATGSYDHSVQPNILLRQLTVSDTVALTGFVPIPRTDYDVSGTVSYTASRSLLSDDGFQPPGGHGLILDVAFGWVYEPAFMRLEGRYQFFRQFEGEPDSTGNVLMPNLQRHALLATITFGYPDSPAQATASPFQAVGPSMANPDILAQQAPKSERAEYEEKRDADKKRKEDRERRGGDGD